MNTHANTAPFLLHKSDEQRVYCKGMYLFTSPGLIKGIDFRDIELSRDRSMVASIDEFKKGVSEMWSQCMQEHASLVPIYYDILCENNVNGKTNETSYEVWDYLHISQDVNESVCDVFYQLFKQSGNDEESKKKQNRKKYNNFPSCAINFFSSAIEQKTQDKCRIIFAHINDKLNYFVQRSPAFKVEETF